MRIFECPNCGSNIHEGTGEFAYCPYCGTKIDTYDKRIKIHKVTENIADIKRIDVQMLAEQNRHDEELRKMKQGFWNEWGLGIVLVGLFFGLLILLKVFLFLGW